MAWREAHHRLASPLCCDNPTPNGLAVKSVVAVVAQREKAGMGALDRGHMGVELGCRIMSPKVIVILHRTSIATDDRDLIRDGEGQRQQEHRQDVFGRCEGTTCLEIEINSGSVLNRYRQDAVGEMCRQICPE